MTASDFPQDPDTHLATLGNGVRVLTLRTPQLESASVAVFVRSGSQHESAALNGISHVVEHMAFKGTALRDARRINLDAERLGAEVNAHTDKDHTAFYMHGLAEHATRLLPMLADIVRHPTFPADELERERQVLLHEWTEDDDDPLSTAFQLFDRTCWGDHPLAQNVMGPRRNLERVSREALLGWVRQQYSGHNVVVAVAGAVDPDAIVRGAEAAFGDLQAGTPHRPPPPVWHGGIATRRQDGGAQAHLVLGYPLPGLAADDPVGTVAAAVLGEGMSSPLLERIREQRALAYYTACSADVLDGAGQFVIEASTAPGQLDELLREVLALLAAHARRVAPADLERARLQLTVRRLRAHERPYRRLEDAVLDLFALGRLRSAAEWRAGIHGVGAEDVRAGFERMQAAGIALALVGSLPRAASQRVREMLAALQPAAA